MRLGGMISFVQGSEKDGAVVDFTALFAVGVRSAKSLAFPSKKDWAKCLCETHVPGYFSSLRTLFTPVFIQYMAGMGVHNGRRIFL